MAVRRQLTDVLGDVLRASRQQVDFEVKLVWNNTNRRNISGPTRYFAQLSSAAASRIIRDAFSGFFRQSNPLVRPQSLSQVSIRNKVTLATRVRIAIMRQLGLNYKDKNAGSSFAVKGFESRPQLTLFPPSGARDARQRTLNFIEAVTLLPAVFSDDQLVQIYRVIGTNFRSRLTATFVVLHDDDHDRLLAKIREADQARRTEQSGRHGGQQLVGPALTYAGVVQQDGDGMDLQSGFIRQLRQPPPPPPPPPRVDVVESPSVHGSPRRSSRPPSGSTKRRRSPSPRKRSSRRRRRSRSTSSSSSQSSSNES